MLQAVHGWSSAYERLVKSQKFFSSYLTQEDMSRLGRNYLEVGFYTEVMFPKKGIRFIAINSSVDSAKPNDNDFSPFINIMNEWYAKDTSNKIKSVFDARMKSGLRVSASVPYGYYRDPADKQHILIDPVSAAVVQRIFQMMADGMNTGDICRTLTEEKVLTPAAYAKEYHPEQCRARVETGFCKWNRTVVLEILKRQEYLGHTILKKTVSMNFKTKERRDTTEEEQYFFPNTHEPIISEELWEKAQRNRRIVERKRLNDDIKATSVFLGLLYCSECGRKLRFGIEEKDSTGHIIMHYTCGGYLGDYGSGCTSHYINEEDLKALLTEYLRIMTKRIIQDEAAFIKELSEKWKLHQEAIPARANEDLKHTQERYAELGSRLTKLYEDFAAGLLPERQYRSLMEKYDKEQQELEKRLTLLEEEIETVEIREINPQRFVDLIKKYKDVTDLHRGMVRELIDNNIQAFLESTGYITFEPGAQTTTRQLYGVYKKWCYDNAEKASAMTTFARYLGQQAEDLGIIPNKNIKLDLTRRARGYDGIRAVVDGFMEIQDDDDCPFP